MTIAGGALFGTIGLVLGAPLTSAAIKISSDLAKARAQDGGGRAAGGGRTRTRGMMPGWTWASRGAPPSSPAARGG